MDAEIQFFLICRLEFYRLCLTKYFNEAFCNRLFSLFFIVFHKID